QLRDIPILTVNNTPSYEFWLDINQNNGNDSNLLSLDRVQIYTSTVASQTTTNVSSLGALRYNMDQGGDNAIKMDYNLAAGSGQGDIRMYIPVSYFLGSLPTDYLYLYSEFGEGFRSNDGYEEWAVNSAAVPGPGGLAVLGIAVAARRRR